MNPNDLLAQQQALLGQAMERSQNMMWGMAAVQVALLIVVAWVIYMYYARLSDIATELLKIRVAFEMAEDRKARAAGATARPPSAASGENPFATDERYRPNPGK